MSEYDDYVSGRVDARYEKWLDKNLPEHRPEDLTRGHWCDFCQTFHSSQSCYHPGGNMLLEAQNRIAELTLGIKSLTERCGDLEDELAKYKVADAGYEAGQTCIDYGAVGVGGGGRSGYVRELQAKLAAAEAQVERLAHRPVIDVRPDGRYFVNVDPVVLNVIEDGIVEYPTLALRDFAVTREARP